MKLLIRIMTLYSTCLVLKYSNLGRFEGEFRMKNSQFQYFLVMIFPNFHLKGYILLLTSQNTSFHFQVIKNPLPPGDGGRENRTYKPLL